MEEKERYEYIHNDEIGDGLLDIKTNNEIYDIEQMSALLNQQDKEIIKLRGENQQLKQQLEIFKKFNDALQQDNLDLSYDKVDTAYEYAKEMAENWEKDYQEEIQQLREDLQAKDILVNTYMSVVGTLDNAKQLKQEQKQLAISELEKVKEKALHFYVNDTPKLTSFYVDVKEIDSQIKSLKGEE